MLRRCGVRYLGFPLRLSVHREDLSENEAAAIIKSLAPPVFGVLITYLDRASEIAAFVMRSARGSCSSMATSNAMS
jgi:phosphoribosylanthranilate isomerase